MINPACTHYDKHSDILFLLNSDFSDQVDEIAKAVARERDRKLPIFLPCPLDEVNSTAVKHKNILYDL